MKTEYICENCKRKALSQRNITMHISLGYCKVGECEWCGDVSELLSYKEEVKEHSNE